MLRASVVVDGADATLRASIVVDGADATFRASMVMDGALLRASVVLDSADAILSGFCGLGYLPCITNELERNGANIG